MKKVIMMLLGIAFATCAWALDPVKYMTWDPSKKELFEANTTSYTVVTADTATLGNGFYVVNSTVSRGTITVNGAARLILCDGASLTVTGGPMEAGINVLSGKSLAIYGQSEGTGKLEAIGGHFSAGIGGKDLQEPCGTITINSGKIKATGGDFGAGIGSGNHCSTAATITINGGNVEAIGGAQGAGIGSGNYSGSPGSRGGIDNITINGGTIKASGGEFGAGIGSGSDGFAAKVTINGGEITASATGAQAIGSGKDAKAATVTFGEGVEVSIKAGATEYSATETAVDAFVANHAAKYAKIVITPKDPIEYLTWDEETKSLVATNTTSYTVVTKDTATFEDKKWYVVTNTIERAGIKVNGAAHLILCDGASLTVTGAEKEAGIQVAEGKSLTIYGQNEGTGKLDAKSGDYGAAIGGRDMSACGNVTINGGTVAANGGVCAAGIGGGYGGRGGTLTINGGKVTTIGGLGGAGIGGGYGADGGMLTINGGTVTSNGGCAGRYSAAGIGAGCVDSAALSDGTVTFAEGVEFSIVAGDNEDSAADKAMADFVADHSAAYVKIEQGLFPKVTLDEIIEGEDWTKFDVAYTLDNLEEGIDYKVLIDVTAGGVTKSITNATDIVIGSFTNSVDTVKLFGGKVFDEKAKVKVSLGTWKELKWTQLWKDGPFFAEYNVGAKKPEDAGKTYTFAELEGLVKEPMRVPTNSDLFKLEPTYYNKVDVTWDNEKNGAIITGRGDYASNSIFLPTTGTNACIWAYTLSDGGDMAYTYFVNQDGGKYYVVRSQAALTEKNAVRVIVDPDKVDSVRMFFDPISTAEKTVELLAPPVEYLDWTGTEFVTATNRTYDVVTAQTKTFEKGWYIVDTDVECGSIKVNGEEAYLILCDGAKLTVTGAGYEAGVEVVEGKSLTIYGQSEGTGELEANGGKYGAGIGGYYQDSCGTIMINGGTIKATGEAGGAGIGGGFYCTTPATITINGGEIEAIGGNQAAGIGSGDYYGFKGTRNGTDTITINGGTIKATGGKYGAGIGSGSDGFAATIAINGGAITALTPETKDGNAQAIGSGDAAKAAATVTFGAALASKYVWAGASATACEGMTTTAFATNHSASYVELPVETYEVAYDANGATGTMSNSVFAVTKEVTLKKNAFTALGYDFAGWTTNGTDVVYADEAKDTDFATTNATLTLTAKWELDSNGVTATDFTSLTNLIAQAATQGANLPITIDFTSGVVIPEGETVTLPSGTGFDGLKYLGDDEGGSNLYIEDGVLYGDVLRGEVTVDALVLMQHAMGGSVSSFKALSAGETEGSVVTNDVVMLLGDNGKAYFNDTDDVDEMIADILAADPRPTKVKLYEVKGAIVTFEAMGGIIGSGTDPLGNDYDGGVERITYLCMPDSGYELPEEVTREGYTLKGWFDGWTTSDNEITNNQEIVTYSEHSLYAQWTSTAPVQSEEGELHFADIVDDEPVKEIAAKKYAKNTELKVVTTPIYLEKIGQRAFTGCESIEKLTLTATLDYGTLDPTTLKLEPMAFAGCKSLKELTIGGDVEIGVSAFQNCTKLEKIIFRGNNALTCDASAFVFAGTDNGKGEIKLYMTQEFQANNTELVNNLMTYNNGIVKVDVVPVEGIGLITIPDGSVIVPDEPLAFFVKTIAAGTPDVDSVDIQYSTDMTNWSALKDGTAKIAYPDGTIMIEVTVPKGSSSGFFKAVLNTQQD